MKEWLEQHILHHIRNTALHPLQKIALTALIVLTAIAFLENSLTPAQHKEADRLLSAVLPGVIVDLTNKERRAENLGTLTRNPLLDEAARLKGMHMRQNDYFAHDSPQGITPWYWFDVVKYDYLHAGENLAVYFDESDEVVQAWMDSPLHKENILKKEYTEIGVAVVEGKYDGYSTYFVVQLFATPENQVQARPMAPVLEKPDIQKIAKAEVATTIASEPQNTVLGEAEIQEETLEEIEFEETFPEMSMDTATDEEAEKVETDGSIVVERIQLDDTTVYISDHASTSTLPLGSTDDTSRQGTLLTTKTLLQSLYVLLVLLAVGLTLISILLAEKQHRHVQAFYGIALLIITTVLLSFHAQVVSATTSII